MLVRYGVKHLYGDMGPWKATRAYCEGLGQFRVAWNGVRLFRKFAYVYQYRNGAVWYSVFRTRRDCNMPDGWGWTSMSSKLLQDT